MTPLLHFSFLAALGLSFIISSAAAGYNVQLTVVTGVLPGTCCAMETMPIKFEIEAPIPFEKFMDRVHGFTGPGVTLYTFKLVQSSYINSAANQPTITKCVDYSCFGAIFAGCMTTSSMHSGECLTSDPFTAAVRSRDALSDIMDAHLSWHMKVGRCQPNPDPPNEEPVKRRWRLVTDEKYMFYPVSD